MIELNKQQQISMLKLARKTIADTLNAQYEIDIDLGDPVFIEKCGAFVTLHKSGQLRGCIGYIQGIKKIPETVIDMAKAAAFKDPRFPPLNRKEYEDIDIEISILSPIQPVTDISDIVVGRDGLIISQGFRSGLLLPQVPVEQGWDRETFLENTCYKAGLPGDSWKKKDIKLEMFSAQVFSEKGLGL